MSGALALELQSIRVAHGAQLAIIARVTIRMCAGDGFEVGYFQQRFADAKLLNPDGSKSDYVKRMEERAEALSIKDPIHIGINVMLTNCTRWESIMVIVQVCFCDHARR